MDNVILHIEELVVEGLPAEGAIVAAIKAQADARGSLDDSTSAEIGGAVVDAVRAMYPSKQL